MKRPDLTYELASKYLWYNPFNGNLVRKGSNKVITGRTVSIELNQYSASHIVWVLNTKETYSSSAKFRLRFKDENPKNTRFENLEKFTISRNHTWLLPRVNPLKEDEYESPIAQYRLALGMTIKELCDAADCQPGTYSGFQNGTIAPYDRYGKVKPQVIRLSRILDTPISKLFPRYICDIDRNEYVNPNDAFECTSSEHLIRNHEASLFDLVSNKLFIKKVLDHITSIPIAGSWSLTSKYSKGTTINKVSPLQRDLTLMYYGFFDDEFTLQELTDIFGYSGTGERPRQIINKVLGLIRHYAHYLKKKDNKEYIPNPFHEFSEDMQILIRKVNMHNSRVFKFVPYGYCLYIEKGKYDKKFHIIDDDYLVSKLLHYEALTRNYDLWNKPYWFNDVLVYHVQEVLDVIPIFQRFK